MPGPKKNDPEASHVAALVACLRSSGVDVPDGASVAEVEAIVRPFDPDLGIHMWTKAFMACETEVAIPR